MMHRLNLILLLILAAFICGCNQNKDLKRTLERFTSSTINIPDDIECYIYGHSKPINKGRIKPYIFVLFYPPQECLGCAANNLPHYETLRDECYEHNISFIPVFSPHKNDIELIKYYIDESECPFPIYIDTQGSFIKNNPHIPADKRFHAFLLGPDSKPIFVGDPLKNDALKELFKTAIESI